jgi:hypothetical protein
MSNPWAILKITVDQGPGLPPGPKCNTPNQIKSKNFDSKIKNTNSFIIKIKLLDFTSNGL